MGWSISDRITAEIVVDALEMARWRRRPEPGTVVHADRGAQYTSWLFGHRLRQAGLLGSMGRVASSLLTGYSILDPLRRHAEHDEVRRSSGSRVQHVSHDGQGSPAARAA
ncbi:DDE-type integrase/transposase/recombinase [Microbacterium aurum]